MSEKNAVVVVRGGGDLASGVAFRLHKIGLRVLVLEIAQPLAVRRMVSFSEAIYEGQVAVEGTCAQKVEDWGEIKTIMNQGIIPVMIDPDFNFRNTNDFIVVAMVDARMQKKPPELGREICPLVIGLGPGFFAGENCHAVIETNRGHSLGRVCWKGPVEADTGVPGKVGEKQHDRVLRAPETGKISTIHQIGDLIHQGETIAAVGGGLILAPFDGILRGLLRNGFPVYQGMKVGDLDPRCIPEHAYTISDKSLAIAGGVLEALLTFQAIREKLWN